ncbi:MAG: DUF5690 family protein [Sphingobacteriales bacterium]|jgi:MFS family permease
MEIIKSNRILQAIYIALLCFFTYTCVFAFRKPFTVATFEGETFGHLSYQTILIISQVIGYMISKFIGIRFISAMNRNARWKNVLFFVGLSWLSLFFFALVPPMLGILCFVVNGFMLGFMWGVIFSYAEGRRSTDFIGSVLAISFVFAGGFTRSVGKWLMVDFAVSEKWMPFCTGFVFALPLILLIYLMEKVPMPDEKDISERQERVSMSKQDRKLILVQFGAGIILLALIYTTLTIMRDIRDNYMSNMWAELGYANNASVFTSSETRITVILLIMMSAIVLIRKNMQAFRLIHVMVIVGFLTAAVSSYLYIGGQLGGAYWMQAVGLGLYMAYIPFNSIFFERMIAAFRLKGNVGFLIYITDAVGYVGSVCVMLSKELLNIQLKWTDFYAQTVLILATAGSMGTLVALLYFNRKYKINPL